MMHHTRSWPRFPPPSSFPPSSDHSHLCPAHRSRPGVADPPLRVLVIHPDAAALASISDRLVQEGVRHVAVVGSTDRPHALLQDVYRAGVHDLHEFLFIHSMVWIG
jgi:hypothetical protein